MYVLIKKSDKTVANRWKALPNKVAIPDIGDVVFSPFAGVGSEGVGALELDRKFIGIELKESYFNHACKFLENSARRKMEGMLPGFEAEVV